MPSKKQKSRKQRRSTASKIVPEQSTTVVVVASAPPADAIKTPSQKQKFEKQLRSTALEIVAERSKTDAVAAASTAARKTPSQKQTSEEPQRQSAASINVLPERSTTVADATAARKTPSQKQTSGEQQRRSAASKNVPKRSTSDDVSSSDDDNSSNMASAEGQETEIDDALLEGIINGREDAMNKFLLIAFKLMNGEDTISEQLDRIIDLKLSEYLDKKSEIIYKMHAEIGVLLKIPQTIEKFKHPAPTPTHSVQLICGFGGKLPPAPAFDVRSDITGHVVLTWNIDNLRAYSKIKLFEIFAYEEKPTELPSTSTWKKIGDVYALPLPMSCSLTQLERSKKYHFAIRAVDVHKCCGPFSTPKCLFM